MGKVEKEIMQNLYVKLLEQLEDLDKLDDFVSLVEQPLLEAVVNFSDGDMGFASSILGVSQSSLEKRLAKEFGSKDVVGFHVLLRKMREKRVKDSKKIRKVNKR